MRIDDPGHEFMLRWLDTEKETEARLIFVKRVGDGYPGNEPPAHPGTNCQEVIRALIARVQYLDKQIPHVENRTILYALRLALYSFELRAAERHGRLEAFEREFNRSVIETYATCAKCGHVGCGGECHE